jgi:hypothetical protein
MCNDVLVISDALVEPPTEVIPFRTITMLCEMRYAMECVLHTTQDMKDSYYHWMKRRGMMDHIVYILNESEWEEGVRLDVMGIYPNSIVTKAIRIENQLLLLSQIKGLAGK